MAYGIELSKKWRASVTTLTLPHTQQKPLICSQLTFISSSRQ